MEMGITIYNLQMTLIKVKELISNYRLQQGHHKLGLEPIFTPNCIIQHCTLTLAGSQLRVIILNLIYVSKIC